MKTPEIDYRKAFIPATAELEAAVEEAFERGEREMKKRYKMITLLSAAAALALVFAVGALAAGGLKAGTPDSVVYSAGSVAPTEAPMNGEPLPAESEGEKGEKTEIALRVYLDEMYEKFCTEKGRERKASALYQTLGALLELDGMKYGAITREDIIRSCLTSVLEMDEDFIRENGMTEVIEACLDGADAVTAELTEDEVVADEVSEEKMEEDREEDREEDVAYDADPPPEKAAESAADADIAAVSSAEENGGTVELAQDDAELAANEAWEGTVVILTQGTYENTQEEQGYYFMNEESAATETGRMDEESLRKFIEEYAPFGVSYDAGEDAWFWNGECVRYFLDVLGCNGEEDENGRTEWNMRSFMDLKGSVDIKTVRDDSDLDENGYGRLTDIVEWKDAQEDPIAEVRFQWIEGKFKME